MLTLRTAYVVTTLALAGFAADLARADDLAAPAAARALGRPAPPTTVADARVAPRGATGANGATWATLAEPAPAASATLVGGAGECRYRAGPTDGCCPPADPWCVAFTLPIWIPSVSGTFASGDTEVETDREPGVLDKLLPDAATSLEFAFMGRLAVEHGPFTFAADGFYAALEEALDWKLRDEDTTGTLDGTVGRVYAAWQTRVALGCRPCAPTLAIGPVLGARVFNLDIHVDRANGDDIDREKWWVDVLGGLKADITFANRASVSVLADFGGSFEGTSTSWSLTAELAWPLGRNGRWFVLLGWTILDLEHDVGSGDDRYEASLELSGPHVGITYRF